ncbi:hypothetical protein [Rhodoferax sp.]|uniref:hypothetical protein n=1 Tax=Rhodoferax sp. TaxID=50421 RepID=UPI00284849D2|nr:hypothetical protein [Rhodoferax sp.]MDR3368418.1 hypothetical protein [Rhodoferax sp.]
MSFQYNSYSLADITVGSISGRGGVGIAQIYFGLSFSVIYNQKEPVTVRDIRVKVEVASDGSGSVHFLGLAQTEIAWQFTTKAWSQTESNQFLLTLTDGQLFALEKLRNGLGLRFQLTVSAMAYGDHGPLLQNESKSHDINSLTWAKVLRDLGGDEYLTVAISLPRCEPDSALAPAVSLIKKAHKALLDGQYEFAVSNCRLAIDSARTACDEEIAVKEAVALFPSKKTSMTKLQRELLIEESARHYTHLAHHAGDGGQFEIFSRDDALLLLSVSVGVISSCSRRHGL